MSLVRVGVKSVRRKCTYSKVMWILFDFHCILKLQLGRYIKIKIKIKISHQKLLSLFFDQLSLGSVFNITFEMI